MNTQFQIIAFQLNKDSLPVILSSDGSQKMLNLSRIKYEEWLRKTNKLTFPDAASGEPYLCSIADYWEGAHHSYIHAHLHAYISQHHFLQNGCAYTPVDQSHLKQQRVKYLCAQVRDMLTNSIVMLNSFEDSLPHEQHNYVGVLPAVIQDIKVLALQLVAAVRNNAVINSDFEVDPNGKLSFTNETK